MKLGIIISSNEPETVWNAFRFGNLAMKQGDAVKVFLIAKGVEVESIDTDKFKVTEQMRTFLDGSGKIYTCTTCLKLRNSQGSDMCPMSTLKDMYEIIKESDKVVTF